MSDSNFAKRLKEARQKKGFNQSQLAEALGVSLSTIQNYERGTTAPKAGMVQLLGSILECNDIWLLGGEELYEKIKEGGLARTAQSFRKLGESELVQGLRKAGESLRPLMETGRALRDAAEPFRKTAERIGERATLVGEQGWSLDEPGDYVQVPIVKGQLSAGGGRFVTEDSEEVIDYVAFRRDWLLSLGRPKDFKIMAARGDSMEPVISDNDLILFDISRTDPRPGKIYAIAYDGHIYVKRLFSEPGRLILRSENRVHSDIIVDLRDESRADTVQVLGRIIWWCHTEAL